MLADQEIYALSNIRVPVSRLQKQILDNKNHVPICVQTKHGSHKTGDINTKKELNKWSKGSQIYHSNSKVIISIILKFNFSLINLKKLFRKKKNYVKKF